MRVCPKCGKNYFQSERFCAVDGAGTEEVPDSSDPRSMIGARLGAYKITALLGEGGMGMVFRAEHQAIGREVALKVLHEELAGKKDVVERFFTEAKAVNRIKHENIIEITDFDTTAEGKSYFVMELLEGRSLSQTLQEEGPFDFGRAVRVGAQIADALEAAHKHEIVHRDLKPENVFLITRSGMRDFVKLLDFGIAKLTGGQAGISKTRTGMIIGTPAYMSPEQAQGEAIDGRTDMYAWGIILYEMVTGRPPFGGENVSKILLAHVGSPPPPPHQYRPDLPAPLEALILKCLSKERTDRYANMVEAKAALYKAAEGLADVRSATSQHAAATSGTGAPIPAVLHPTPAPGYEPLPGAARLSGAPLNVTPPPLVGPAGSVGTNSYPGTSPPPPASLSPSLPPSASPLSSPSAVGATGTIPPTSGTPYPAAEAGRSGGAGVKIAVAVLVVLVCASLGTGTVMYLNGVEPVKSMIDGLTGPGDDGGGKGKTKPTSAEVKFKSDPPGATVWMKASKPKELGKTPFETKLPTDEFVTVTFKLTGYADKSVTFDPASEYDVPATLDRVPGTDTGAPVTSGPLAVKTGAPDTSTPGTSRPDGVGAPPAPEGMVYLIGGAFSRGSAASTDDYERPPFDDRVEPFFLDKTEVSNGAYAAFVATGAVKTLPKGWKAGLPPADAESLPVVNVTWDEAKAYCEWKRRRLPTEAEWEFAAKGGEENRVYPWGNRYDDTLANGKTSGSKRTMAVDSLEAGAAASGALHLAGNVYEWTASSVDIYPGSDRKKAVPMPADYRVIRGGSYDSKPEGLTSTARVWLAKSTRKGELGFRCAAAVP
jgi:serine/threonine protein kinase/formylglycine-generating enzyme required for sulfatase activity